MRKGLVAAALCLTMCAAVAHGDVYRCGDENGKARFTDKPTCAGAERLEVKRPDSKEQARVPSAAERQRRRRRLLNVYREEREAARAQAEQDQQRRAQARRNCNVTRDRLAQMRGAGYLYDLDDKGERRAFSPAERRRAVAEARQQVERWCGP